MYWISMYTIFETVTSIIFTPYVARWVGNMKSDIMKSLSTLLIKNLLIIAGLVQLVFLTEEDFREMHLIYVWIFCVSTSFIFNNTNKILVEKYWFKVWLDAEGTSEGTLRVYNSAFNYTKQLSRILSPVLVTPIIEYELSHFAQIMLVVQVILLGVQISTQLYGLNYLHKHLQQCTQKNLLEEDEDSTESDYTFMSFLSDPLFFKMLSLSLLYCTLLDFSYQSIGYLYEHPGISHSDSWVYFISICRGLAAITSAAGVAIYNFFSSASPTTLGIWGLVYFIATLVPILIFSIADELVTSDSSMKNYFSMWLLICMTMSRAGLWLFDTSVQQIIVDNVKNEHMSVFNGYCESMNYVFFLLMNIMTLIFEETALFNRFAIWSVINLCVSLAMFMLSPNTDKDVNAATTDKLIDAKNKNFEGETKKDYERFSSGFDYPTGDYNVGNEKPINKDKNKV